MKYVIRKVPERNTEYLERLLPNAHIYNDVNHEGCLVSFLKVLYEVNDDAVYIADDMILCKNFMSRTKEYIDKYPNEVIVFSNFTKDKSCRDVVTEGFWSARKGGWMLCTYIPKRIADGFLKWWTEGRYKKYNKNWIKWQMEDAYFCRYLEENGLKVYVVIPNLAGHPLNHSVIDGRASKTTTNFNFEEAEV